jgi:hypothetical protein
MKKRKEKEKESGPEWSLVINSPKTIIPEPGPIKEKLPHANDSNNLH